MTRSRENRRNLEGIGAEAVVLSALDRPAVLTALWRANPEVVIYQLSALVGAETFKEVAALLER